MSFLESDNAKVALATLVPGAAGLASYAMLNSEEGKKGMAWWQGLKKPSWAPKEDKVYYAVDALTSLPLGCASYLVYKEGGGFEDKTTAMALGAYGASLGMGLLCGPLIMHSRDIKKLTGFSAVLTATTATTAFLFHKVHNTAGYMTMPWALWTGFYLVLMAAIMKEENASAKK